MIFKAAIATKMQKNDNYFFRKQNVPEKNRFNQTIKNKKYI